MELGERATLPVGRALDPVGSVSEPDGRVVEPAVRENESTVEVRSKEPGGKRNSPKREMILGPISYFLISILALKEFQSMGKIKPVP